MDDRPIEQNGDSTFELSPDETACCDALAQFASDYWSTGLHDAISRRDEKTQRATPVQQDVESTTALAILSAVMPAAQVAMLGQASDSYTRRRHE